MKFFDGLNDKQQEAAGYMDGALLVIAGAGSGKTRVLTRRIAWMLEQGVKPEEILAITFTNKAAKEMKGRIGSLVGSISERLWVSTFHSMGNRILRRDIHRLGYDNNFVIYDTDDSTKLFKKCAEELVLDDTKFTPRAVLAGISKLKNDLKSPKEAELEADDYYQETVAKVYKLYQRKLKEANALDFDDLQYLLVKLFSEHREVLERYQNQFKYISIDEYQDTNNVQYTLVKMLAGKHKNICVVGDPDQSIYGWRGANMQNIMNFEKDYLNARVVKLEQNYRSTGTILQAANHVIANNIDRKDKKLWTDKGNGDKLFLYEGQDENHEAYFIGSEIAKAVNKGRKYDDFAVLYRTNAQSRALEKTFLRQGIPFRIYGGLSFYARKEIKDILAYLKVINNSKDVLNLTRIINVPKRGIGAASVERVLEYAEQNGISVYEALKEIDTVGGSVRNRLIKLYELLESFRETADKVSLTELVEKILEDTGYMESLKAERTVEAVGRIENLQEFLTETKDFDKHSEEKTLEEFLAATSLYSDLDQEESEYKVTLMTMHAAKGLEFPVVFVTGLEENIFPHQRAAYNESEMEEERRICYVAITRGMEKVYLTRAWQRNIFGVTKYNKASRFLEEIPEECITGFRKREEAFKPKEKVESIGEGGADLKLGDHVMHAKWGEGVIVKTEGSGATMQISIAFPGMGIRVLVAEYAPIKKL